jgi:hypothetical protein
MPGRILSGLCILLLSGAVAAIDRIELEWGAIEADGWRLSDVSVELDWSAADPSRMTFQAALLERGEQRIENLQLACERFELLPAAAECRQGRLTFSSDWLEADAVPAAIHYRFDTGQLSVVVSKLPLAGGQVRLDFNQQRSGWRLATKLDGLEPGGLAGLIGAAGFDIPDFDYQGHLGGELSAAGDAQGVKTVAWDLHTRAAGFSNAEGSQAGESLRLVSSGTASADKNDWRVDTRFAARQGVLYIDPLYLEFSELQPLQLSASMRWHTGDATLELRSLAFNHADIVTGSASAVLVPAAATPVRQLDLEIEQARLPGLYQNWLQPWLSGTVLEDLDTEGSVRGRVSLTGQRLQSVQMELDQVSFRERDEQFGVQNLDGALRWADSDDSHAARLTWQGANYHQLRLGAAEVELRAERDAVSIVEPLVVSLLDGELHLDQFELGRDDEGAIRWLVDAMLTPVSMKAFSTALGWPPLAGKLSGMIPRVRYEKGELTLGGTLLVQAFDGGITVRNLRIQQPLGLVPRLWADARLEQLDLDTLTRAFSFGRIEGKLQGEVKELYMEAWQLVAFDARFETPPDDDSRHRISQKAVDNISNLGGSGMGGAVSRGFLRFLEDFPYSRLGIRCRLENGVCHMGGVAPAETGYYLVQGRLLPPRLDVIGYSEQVAWQSLVDRLVSITSGEGPRVE